MDKTVKFIIVQAGGKGTRMEQLTRNKPKALVPVDNLPILFHLFRKYPEGRFVIIGDYKIDVLRKYLEAFSKADYTLVDAGGGKGTCAGIGAALEFIPDSEPFMLIWSDLILPKDFVMPGADKNYIGISKDFRCRWSLIDGELVEEASTEHGVAGQFIFRDKKEIAGVPAEGEFVRWLSGKNINFEELPLYRTKEYGLISEYKKQEKTGRCRPFNRITFEDDRIIKEAIDDQGRALAIREKAWYERIRQHRFDNIPVIFSTDPLIMERINGRNIFEYELDFEEKKKVLREIVGCIDSIHSLEGCPSDRGSYYEAYIGKTFDRLKKVRDLVPFADNESFIVNGVECKNVFYCKDELEKRVMEYFPKEFRLLHGDCTFSNMLLKNGTTPVLIDPRGYFGTTELYGDPAYDWAKIYYSIAGNYDQFNLKRFDLKIEENEVFLEIESNKWEETEDYYLSLLRDIVTKPQMKLLHAIIYLSLTTYAWEDYDSVCGAFYKGSLLLTEALEG